MRYRSSSSLSYRNVLIAAGLAVGLGVGAANAEPGATSTTQPRSDEPVDRSAALPPPLADGTARGFRR
jgi:hypothetical protein